MSDKGAGVVITGSPAEKPKGLIEAISEIERLFAMEDLRAEIHEKIFTLKNKLEFFEVGFKSALVSGLITASLTPLAIGVIEKIIPVFGSTNPTLFDQMFVFLLALSFSIGYAIFVSSAGRYYRGNITKQMISNLFTGLIIGSLLKIAIVFPLFHIVYYAVITKENIIYILKFFVDYASKSHLLNIYVWMVEFRPVFLLSAWFILVSTVIFISIPLITLGYSILKDRRKNKHIKELGLE